ncbi:MAG: 4Fe-4S dicluster domain-containing protein [Promethearchaeota archaeon]|nr:MAG: 4Fe-4S dicluster domain-containing protein [Candidatus Lokiarchaeota archaeon]
MGNFEDLEKEVIEKGLCSHCGACVSTCPDYNIDWETDDQPHRDKARGMCENCTECYDSCYRVKGHFDNEEMEKFLFGRARNETEPFGIYRKIITAQATDPEILNHAQDGGLVSALGLYLLETNKVDGIITTGQMEGQDSWKPIPMIVKTREELLKSAGTKYYIAPILQMLKVGVIDQELDRLAIVGLPCQVRSARY